MTAGGQRIGSAPVSFGIHGGVDMTATGAHPERLLDAIADAGYLGSELGPPGYFGSPEQTARRFRSRGLSVIGAYVPLHLSGSDETLAADLEGMRVTLDELGAAGDPSALAVLADEGGPELIRAPFRRAGERGLTGPDWSRALERVAVANELARSANIRTTYHPHFATYVEQASEIEALLTDSDIPLCIDTGHFMLGGADPVDVFDRWMDRVNHVHVKDARLAVRDAAASRGATDVDSWWGGLSCRLGHGDAAVERFLRRLSASDYDGWLVVEQDGDPATAATWAGILSDQRVNRQWVEDVLGGP